ncbi:16S rRNA (guanine(966)-N(2))-methyltransferase RsmD [Methylonatrum kenyense]|uniref:16S rRNA (guanine(966)-N(2))-methyltransferase RsmD n=1 Tax=Methylonatrum kenyense TaxID=455253 RepID=UPI0020BEB68F|nr:16S rRNA (guanine(966)-N(2))-methyltransferase RsmD [Methylonatrum kenyense]MCK8515492.1 16S rRNA (guanine(966)-N(2))-methyltransferase RsmD [Methylonatrum kenyense]
MTGRGRQQLRIIGGRWRGRRVQFADLPGLRPTADRNRETLFNWLQPVLPGSRCLDLFAGSGALGLEAASRGAGHVLLVEQAGQALRHLRAALSQLEADNVSVWAGDARQFLRQPAQAFDIVFLDPPFASALLEPVCEQLERGHWLASDARIYLEHAVNDMPAALPGNWLLLREKQAGQVRYALYRREAA